MQSAETVLDVVRDNDHDIVTGEPGDRKRSRRVREGGVGKGPARAPRRRRTSARCHPGAIERQWTRERVREAMRAWHARYGSPPRYDAGEVPLRVLFRRRPPKPGVTVSDHRALQ